MRSKLIYIIAAVVLVAALVTGISIYWVNSNSYVATVAGEKITKAEYNFFLKQAMEEMQQTASITDENSKKTFWDTKIEGKDAREIAKNKALDYAKEFKINLIKAKENKTALDKVETDGIDNAVESMVKDAGGRVTAEEQIKSAYNINLSEYKAIYQNYMLISKFISQEQSKVQVTDQDIKDVYNSKYENENQATVRHILISTVDSENKPLPADKQEEAKKKAEEVLAKVKAAGDMKALAKEYSEDPGSKDNAGQYTFGKGEMVKEFEEWSFKAKPGDAAIVKSNFGYHVMKKPLFDELDKESLKKDAQGEKLSKDVENWKKDPKFDAVKNQRVFDSIKVI